MSDFPQGTDWWKASDGLWYPPPATTDASPPQEVQPERAETVGAAKTSASPETVKEPDGWAGMGAQNSVPPTSKWRAALWTIAAIVGFGALVGMCSSGSDDEGDSAEDLRFGAFDVCTTFVEQRLKAPGTAKFRNYFQDDGEVQVSGVGEGPYTVRSSVDAENSFGAQLRMDFTCTVTHTGDGNWRLVDIDIVE